LPASGSTVPAGARDVDDVVAVALALDDDHPQRRLDSFLGSLEKAVLKPALLAADVLEDQDFVGGLLQQRVVRRLDGVGVADRAGDLDPRSAQRPEGGAQALLGLVGGLVDVAEGVAERVRLDRRGDQPHPQRIALLLAPQLGDRLGTAEGVGDDRQQIGHLNPSPS